MTFSLLLEVVGALLWYEALKPVPAVVTEKVTVTPESNAVTHPVTPVVTLPLNQAVETEGVTAAVTGATDAGTVLSNAGTTPVTPPVTHVTPLFNQDVSAFETDSVTPVTGISNVLSNAGTGTVTPVTQPGTAPVTHVTQNAIDEFAKLTEAVKVGACKSTVSGIRGFLACGQTRAVELRRALVEAGAVA